MRVTRVAKARQRGVTILMIRPFWWIRPCLAAIALGLLAPMAQAQTVPGVRLGLEGSFYDYSESAAGTRSGGTLDRQVGAGFGVTAADSFVFANGFVTVDARVGAAATRYAAPGLPAIAPVWNPIGETRAVVGTDFRVSASTVVSPFAGLGYRVLYDDLDGGRVQQYLYVPVGISVGVTSGPWVLRPTVEFDGLLQGWNDTSLGAVGYSNDVHFRQSGGYGLRASFDVETDSPWGRVSMGPFVRYWSINASNVAYATGSTCFGRGAGCVGTTARQGFFEPQNMTVESGLAVTLRF